MESYLNCRGICIVYIIDLHAAKVVMAKDSAFIPTLKDRDFPLRPLRSYRLKMAEFKLKDRSQISP